MASPQRSNTESMNAPNGLTLPVARASVPSNMSKAPPTKTMIPPTSHCWPARSRAPTTEIPKPMSVSPFGVRPSRPMPSAIGSKTFLMRPRDSLEIDMAFRLAREAEDGALVPGEFLERLRAQLADGLATLAAGHDDTRGAEPGQVPRDEGL